MLLRALRKQAGRPSPVLAVKLRGGTTVVRDLSLVRTRIRRMTVAQVGIFNPADLNTFAPMLGGPTAITTGKKTTAITKRTKPDENSKSWAPDGWVGYLVQGPWHVLTPAGLAILNTCGNLCGLVAAATHDYITMRAFSVGATTAVAAFNFMMPKPLKMHQWTAGSWGAVFAMLHLVNLTVLLHANSHTPFSEEEEEIFQNGFMRYGVTPHQFTHLINSGAQYMDYMPGEVIAGAGTEVDKVFYLVRGSCEARHPQTNALRIEYHDNVFIGCLEPKQWQADCRRMGHTYDEPDNEDSEEDDLYGRRNIRAMLAEGLEEKTGPRTRLLIGTSWKNNNVAGPEGCRMMYWPLASFADVVGKDDKLVRAMERVDEIGLACKMCWGASHMALEGYKELLETVSSAGLMIRPEDKRALARYRARFAVSEAEHLRIIQELGWTPKAYDDGFKHHIM